MDGDIITPEYSNRFIRIDLDDYRRIPHKTIIAVGDYKVKAIYGALKAGLADVLITDMETAEALTKFNY